MTPLEFVDYICKVKTPTFESFNFYGDFLLDIKEAVVTRENLMVYLSEMYKIKPKMLLVGEAPGKNGCVLTGIPFTSEYQIANEPFFKTNNHFRIYSQNKPIKEISASCIWEVLSNKVDIPLMWNIYPFHPFDPIKRTNRTPNKDEIQLGMKILDVLLEMFDIKQIYCIGKTASNMLKDHSLYCGYIRHPSHGGAVLCKEQLNQIIK